MANPQKENGHIQVSTEFWDALCKIRLPGQAGQVFNFIIRKTWGWNRKSDRISLSQFVEGTGVPKHRVIEMRAILVSMNMIEVVTEKGNAITEFGNDEITTYSIQKNYEKWVPLPKKVTLPKKVMTVTEKGNASLPNSVPTKDTTTKDTIQKTACREPVGDHQKAIDYFVQTHLEKTGTKYIFLGGKDGKIVSEIMKFMTLGEFKDRVDMFFSSDDEFILKAGFTIGVFQSQINKLNGSGEMSADLKNLLAMTKGR